ncbi:hypothetical protein FOL47_002480, partial [Perkinsus chesapeaki]
FPLMGAHVGRRNKPTRRTSAGTYGSSWHRVWLVRLLGADFKLTKHKVMSLKAKLFQRGRTRMFSDLLHSSVICGRRVSLVADGWTAPSRHGGKQIIVCAVVFKSTNADAWRSYPLLGEPLKKKEKEVVATLRRILLEAVEMLADRGIKVDYIITDSAPNTKRARKEVCCSLNMTRKSLNEEEVDGSVNESGMSIHDDADESLSSLDTECSSISEEEEDDDDDGGDDEANDNASSLDTS